MITTAAPTPWRFPTARPSLRADPPASRAAAILGRAYQLLGTDSRRARPLQAIRAAAIRPNRARGREEFRGSRTVTTGWPFDHRRWHRQLEAIILELLQVRRHKL